MKITKQYIRNIIKEELQSLRENMSFSDDYGSGFKKNVVDDVRQKDITMLQKILSTGEITPQEKRLLASNGFYFASLLKPDEVSKINKLLNNQ